MAAFSANDIGISSLDTIVHDAGIPPKYLDQGEQENDEPLNRSRHRYGYDVNAVIRSDSDTNGPHDRSVVGTRNCCMECFGDEDVENLKFTKFKSIQDEQELLVETNESTDAKYDEPVEDKCQFDSHEPNYSKQNETTDEVHHNKTFVGIIEMMEADEIGKDKSDTDEATAPPVYAGLDTMSSSYAEDDDAESVYSVSFSDIDGNVGCFQWMGAVSSEGLDVDNSMSVVSSESQGESLEGIVVDTSDAARIPISKSEDIATVVPTSNMKNKLLVHSNSIS